MQYNPLTKFQVLTPMKSYTFIKPRDTFGEGDTFGLGFWTLLARYLSLVTNAPKQVAQMIFPRPHTFITRTFLNEPLGLCYRPWEGIHSSATEHTVRRCRWWCLALGAPLLGLSTRDEENAWGNTWICYTHNFPTTPSSQEERAQTFGGNKNLLAGQGQLSDPFPQINSNETYWRSIGEERGIGGWGWGNPLCGNLRGADSKKFTSIQVTAEEKITKCETIRIFWNITLFRFYSPFYRHTMIITYQWKILNLFIQLKLEDD